jgi:hypothetical protein
MNIKETANTYEPAMTLNIADLEVVSTDLDIKYDTGVDKTGKEFTYAFITVDEKQYRIPTSVIAGLKDILSEKPDLTKFRVKKSGEGMNTRYTVIPLI